MEKHFQVKLVSKETVKPSRPTPPNRKTLTLSFLDESFPAIHVHRLLIYTRNDFTRTPLDNLSSNLKTSLSKTLTHFYPLAGRFENEYTVTCNDEGIPFIVTRVDCQLDDFLNSSHMIDMLSDFLPPDDLISLGQRPISTVVPLAFQVNVFACGGIAIGCYSIHKLIDATSMSNFLNYWATFASGRHEDLIEPDFDTIIQVFPPLQEDKRGKVPDDVVAVGGSDNAKAPQAGLSQHLNLPIKVVAKCFKFNGIVIKKLKVDAASETVPNPTSFEAVVGFVWKHAMDAVLGNNNDPQPFQTVLSFAASLRPRTTPPLPKQSMGNIIADAKAHVGYGEGSCSDYSLKAIVREIHVAVEKVKQKLVTLQGENGGEAFLAERNAAFKVSVKAKASNFTVFNWRRLGFNEVNFGFGPPAKIIPLGIIYPFLRNTMMLVDYRDSHGDGIEVYVCLEDKHMPILQANPQFMAFATSS